MSPLRWRIGTVGFGYKEWATGAGGGGAFYPRGVQSSDFLAYYARCFDCVELDTTFHAMPDPGRVRKWAGAVPDDFRFAVKAMRDVTHAEDVGAMAKLFADFCAVLREFGPKLSLVLLQFPPTFTAGRWKELETLVATVPADVPLAAEFRDLSWWTAPNTAAFLADMHITWAQSDLAGFAAPREIRATTPTAYLRLIGEHDRFLAKNQEELDPTESLLHWKAQIENSGVREAWVLANNDYAGFSIATANRLKRLLALPIEQPPALDTTLFG